MPNLPTKRAIVYARVSSDQQRDSGSSLDTQAAACLALAEREGYSVLAVVQESFSGAELWARPKLGQVREQIRNREIDALICYTVDRLTRNIAHLMVLLDECERFGVVPLTPKILNMKSVSHKCLLWLVAFRS